MTNKVTYEIKHYTGLLTLKMTVLLFCFHDGVELLRAVHFFALDLTYPGSYGIVYLAIRAFNFHVVKGIGLQTCPVFTLITLIH